MPRHMPITLPSVLTKESWFYEDNKEMCDPHLGKPYISYSSINSWEDYREDFIKKKFARIELPESIYAVFGSYVGDAVENQKFGENPHGFTGQENLKPFLESLPKGAEYEKMILIDMGEYVILGFIDIFYVETYKEDGEEMDVATVIDLKTGGKGKEKQYEDEKYIQVPIYAKAIEDLGIPIASTGVWFVRRTGSHVNPPCNISEDQFFIELDFNEERVKYAMKKVERVVKEISSAFRTYKKVFGHVEPKV